MTITEELIEEFKRLDESQKRYILDYIRSASQDYVPKGESPERLLASVGMFDTQSLDEMAAAIEEGCEEIDWREWQ